jgi:hypothetical protein
MPSTEHMQAAPSAGNDATTHIKAGWTCLIVALCIIAIPFSIFLIVIWVPLLLASLIIAFKAMGRSPDAGRLLVWTCVAPPIVWIVSFLVLAAAVR